MRVLFVVDRPEQWPFDIPGSSVVTSRGYLTDPVFSQGFGAQVANLCDATRYQGRGYYVSLLAEARGHRPLPSVQAIEELQSDAHVQSLREAVDELVRHSLQHEGSAIFQLDAYFGRDPAGAHAALAQQLFALAQAPLLRAHFRRQAGSWRLEKLIPIGIGDVPHAHRACLIEAATAYVTGIEPARAHAAGTPRLAILRDPDEVDRPSNDAALRKLVDMAPVVGLAAELVGPGDIGRLPEFDALFIRTSTNVGHYTYEFARRAAALGMPVIDDPDSIVRCTNKVYLHELMKRHGVPTPNTLMVHRDNLDQVIPTLGLPCILKQPDSGFGLGVVKIGSEAELRSKAARLLEKSELLVAQEWLPTDFDWRVGVFDGRPLFAAKYGMAPGHWQIIKREGEERVEGETIALAIGEVPAIVIETAVRGANLIGRGLYGVDLKQVGEQCYLIEVNDNPNLDAGNEDQILGDALYREILGVFARRIRERRKMSGSPPARA